MRAAVMDYFGDGPDAVTAQCLSALGQRMAYELSNGLRDKGGVLRSEFGDDYDLEDGDGDGGGM